MVQIYEYLFLDIDCSLRYAIGWSISNPTVSIETIRGMVWTLFEGIFSQILCQSAT